MGAAINIEGKRVLVVGSGLSGAAATELLKKKGAFPVLFDGNRELDTGALRRKSPVFADVEIITGEWRDKELAGVVLAIPVFRQTVRLSGGSVSRGFRSGAK